MLNGVLRGDMGFEGIVATDCVRQLQVDVILAPFPTRFGLYLYPTVRAVGFTSWLC